MADLKISELPVLDGADLDAVDEMALADLSASETRRINTKKFLENGTSRVIADGTIPGAKLVPDSVTAREIGPGAVTASELASGAVVTVAIQDGAVTDPKIANGINGAKLTDDTVTASKISAASLDRGLDKAGGKIGHVNTITAGTRSGISFDAYGHITATAALSGADLPIATSTAVGGVNVPPTGGLTVSPAGALTHGNTVTAGSISGISFDAQGHVTAAVPLVAADLPIATATSRGAVSVPGPGLVIQAGGALEHLTSGVVAGTYSKVAVDVRGHVTAGAVLTASDVPNLDAAKITTGTFAPALFGARSITQQMMGDYAFAYIQESVPSTGVGAHPIGMIWLQESTGQVSVWNGNSWMKTGASTLFNRNLRYGGSYNAATGAITGVTQFGTAEGFKAGDPIPAADDKIAGLYFVASAGGSSSSLAGGAVFDPGDWLLCQGTAGGWVRIDTLSGGGGGGSTVSNLDDLLDVTLTAPTTGDFLQLNNSGQWVNVSVLDEGTWI